MFFSGLNDFNCSGGGGQSLHDGDSVPELAHLDNGERVGLMVSETKHSDS